jgi:ribonuclease VapC
MGLTIEMFTPEDGEITGQLWSQTKEYGLSLGDRACLSLGLRLAATVLTSDQTWKSLDLSVDIQLVC